MSILKLRDLIDEIRDGVEVVFEVEKDAAKTFLKIIQGEGGRVPIKVKINIEEPLDNEE